MISVKQAIRETAKPAQELEVFDLSVFYDDYVPKRLYVSSLSFNLHELT